MRVATFFLTSCLTFPSAAGMQLDYKWSYDDDSEYSIISSIETGPTVQAVIRRVGSYFTSYTMIEIDCTTRYVRQMGYHSSVVGAQAAKYDLHSRFIEGMLAHKVHAVLCRSSPMTEEHLTNLPAE